MGVGLAAEARFAKRISVPSCKRRAGKLWPRTPTTYVSWTIGEQRRITVAQHNVLRTKGLCNGAKGHVTDGAMVRSTLCCGAISTTSCGLRHLWRVDENGAPNLSSLARGERCIH